MPVAVLHDHYNGDNAINNFSMLSSESTAHTIGILHVPHYQTAALKSNAIF